MKRNYRKSTRPWRKYNPSYWFKRTVRRQMAQLSDDYRQFRKYVLK